MAVSRLVALALGTRVDRDDVILLRELIHLLPPNPGGHCPTRNEDNRPSATRFEIVNSNAVGSLEKSALRSLGSSTRYGPNAEKNYSQPGAHWLLSLDEYIPASGVPVIVFAIILHGEFPLRPSSRA